MLANAGQNPSGGETGSGLCAELMNMYPRILEINELIVWIGVIVVRSQRAR